MHGRRVRPTELQPRLAQLNISSGGFILNGHATFNGFVVAPEGTVIINSTLNGGVVSDRLIINGGGVLNAGGKERR